MMCSSTLKTAQQTDDPKADVSFVRRNGKCTALSLYWYWIDFQTNYYSWV